MGLRTSTHAFSYRRNTKSPYAHYHHSSREWPGGFGQQVLGETWINHHGHHGRESTRGVVNKRLADHPILKGVADVWGPTDVYGIRNLPENARVLLYGQVVAFEIAGVVAHDSFPLALTHRRATEVEALADDDFMFVLPVRTAFFLAGRGAHHELNPDAAGR